MKTILLVEDDPILQKIYKDKFELNNYRVETANGGTEALDKVNQKTDFIILDLMLPNLDGAEVLRELKKDPKLFNIPVGILTVFPKDSSKIPEELLSQVNFYWQKDKVNPSDVLEDVSKALQ